LRRAPEIRLSRAEGLDQGSWQTTANNREAKYYALTKAGGCALMKQAERWRRLAGLVDKLLLES
jgi:PadR family transcriptional regulator, regulatory protein PadR